MRSLVAVIALLCVATTAHSQPNNPELGIQSSNVIAAAVGASLTALLGSFGYVLRELILGARERRANRVVFELLHALLDRIKSQAGSDWLAPWGLYYRRQLSSELARLGREKRDLIGGDTCFDLIRLAAALRTFSFERDNPDSSIYSVDELTQEACVTLKRIVPRAIRSESKRKKELEQIEAIRKLMFTGVGAFTPAGKSG
jgi:hypothetical protein